MLSFPMEQDSGDGCPVRMLGDLVISLDTAQRQAEERGYTLIPGSFLFSKLDSVRPWGLCCGLQDTLHAGMFLMYAPCLGPRRFTCSTIETELVLQARTHGGAFMHREVTDMLRFHGFAEGHHALAGTPCWMSAGSSWCMEYCTCWGLIMRLELRSQLPWLKQSSMSSTACSGRCLQNPYASAVLTPSIQRTASAKDPAAPLTGIPARRLQTCLELLQTKCKRG